MQLAHFSILVTLFSLLPSVLTSPQAVKYVTKTVTVTAGASSSKAASSARSPSSIKPASPTQSFYLKTSVFNATNRGSPVDASKEKYNNLWLWAFHTGAGENDAVVSSNKSYAIPGFINMTGVNAAGQHIGNLTFNLTNPFPWGMYHIEEEYAGWGGVQINDGVSEGGYFINATGLQWSGTNEDLGGSFGSWLVCDWWHGVTQLFWRNKFYPISADPTPCGCADVNLVPVYI